MPIFGPNPNQTIKTPLDLFHFFYFELKTNTKNEKEKQNICSWVDLNPGPSYCTKNGFDKTSRPLH